MKNRILISLFYLLFIQSTNANELGHRVHVSGGPHFDSFNVSSEAFSAEQPFTQGQGFVLGYTYFNGQGMQNEIQLNESTVSHTAASSLTPSNVSLRQRQVQWKLLNSILTYNEVNFVKFGLGYTGQYKSADQTTPQVLITNSELHAINFLGSVDLFKRNDLSLKFEFDLGLPVRFKEFGVQSGVNVSTYYYKLNLNAAYQMNSYWSLDLSARYHQFVLTADGLGSRGTQNAKEIQSSMFFPIGVNYDF